MKDYMNEVCAIGLVLMGLVSLFYGSPAETTNTIVGVLGGVMGSKAFMGGGKA